MDVHSFLAIRCTYAQGMETRILYQDFSGGKREPITIGIAPLDCPTDKARWRITHIYYETSGSHVNPIRIRDIEKEQTWDGAGASR